MIVLCGECSVAYDDAEFVTYCPHPRVDGAPVDPVLIFLAVAIADAYLRDLGVPVEYIGAGA